MQAQYLKGDHVELTADNGGLPGGYAWGRKGDKGVVVENLGSHIYNVEFECSRSQTGMRCWATKGENLKPTKAPRPTLATELSLKPFTKTILLHLRQRGSISPLEALAAYGSPRIAPQVHDLRRAGYMVETRLNKDAMGHRYTRYVLHGA